MLLTAAHIAAGFACLLALALARSDKRYVALAVWLGLASGYSVVNDHVLLPIRLAAHQPYHGAARVALHAAQFLFFATQSAFVCAACVTFRSRTRWIVAVALSVLIPTALVLVGYQHVVSPGVYSIGPLVFRSASVATWWTAAATFVACVAIVPGVAKASWYDSDALDRALVGSILVEVVVDAIRVGLPFAKASGTSWTAVPAMSLGACVLIVAFLVSAIFVDARLLVGSREDAEIKRERSKAMQRMDRRLRIARAALAERPDEPRDIATFLDRRPHLRDLVRSESKLTLLFEADTADSSAIDALEKVVAILGSVRIAECPAIMDETIRSFDRSRKVPAPPGQPRWPSGLLIPKDDLVASSRLMFVVPVLAAVDTLADDVAMGVFLMARVVLRIDSVLDRTPAPTRDEATSKYSLELNERSGWAAPRCELSWTVFYSLSR